MSDLRQKTKAIHNALSLDKPIAFGGLELVAGALPKSFYVRGIHGDGTGDIIQELADRIDFSESAGAYLFTGNRGTGKTTELLRLASLLDGQGCEVFYVDLSEYLNLNMRLEISDFLVSVLGALSEKVAERFGCTPGNVGFFERFKNFLGQEVKTLELALPLAGAEVKVGLRDDPTFKEAIQKATRGHVAKLGEDARQFVAETVQLVRHERHDPARKTVLIVDSVERLRGSGGLAQIGEVFSSAENVFSSHTDLLRFTGLSVVYTVPPYLSALSGGLGGYYAGGRIYTLPSMHVYECCPKEGCAPKPSDTGVKAMLAILDKRHPAWREFFTEPQVQRLAISSGGDIRDFLRMLVFAALRAPYQASLPLGENVVVEAENAVRNDMPVLAEDDRACLAEVARTHKARLAGLHELPIFARLMQGKYILNYRNGEDWYDVHPLIRKEVGGVEEVSAA